jgi:hypothetical protein
VVSAAQTICIDTPPTEGDFAGFQISPQRDGSRLSEGIQNALSLLDRDTPGRILVISDGRATGQQLSAAAALAATRGVAIDFRHISRPLANDLAVERLDLPPSIAPGESYLVTAWVRSPMAQVVNYELRCGKAILASGTKALHAGRNRMLFRDTAAKTGTQQYRLTVTPAKPDAVPENDSARAIATITGPKPLLWIGQGTSRLPTLLKAGGLKVDTLAIGSDPAVLSIERLSRYSGVILENAPASSLGVEGMTLLSEWIQHSNGGLWMTGGKNSYAVGGYFESPLGECLPVSMELRKEHRKLSLAMAVVLDRSGSMSMPASGGKSKMDLANIATAKVFDMLTPMDEFAAIAVDEKPHTIVSLKRVNHTDDTRKKILKIESMGGGIYVYNGLKAAAAMLNKSKAGVRHIVLFADAADSEQPGDYKKLLAACTKAGITCSVIGLGSKSDCDAVLLKDVAKRGGGRCMFTNRANDLPRLFAQDTFVVARNSFIAESTPTKLLAGLAMLSSGTFSTIPSVDGYNLCYLRPGATLAAMTLDEYKAPLLASWQMGLGRVACYTGEVDGEYSGLMGSWPRAGELYSSIARWVGGVGQRLPSDMLATQSVERGIHRIRLYLDPAKRTTSMKQLPKVHLLRGIAGRDPYSQTHTLRWETPDSLLAEIPLDADETVLTTLEVPGVGKVNLGPVCLPYSPEYQPRVSGEGLKALTRLAQLTGGVERLDLSTTWEALPEKTRRLSLTPWLALLAAAVLLAEVLHRRTGLLTSISLKGFGIQRVARVATAIIPKARTKRKRKSRAKTKQGASAEAMPEATAPDVPPASDADKTTESVLGAIHKARQNARNRRR